MGLILRDLGNEYAVWDALMQIAAEYPIKSYLEIGTRFGDSLLRVLLSRKHDLERLCIADLWHESYFGPGAGTGTAFIKQNHDHIDRMLRGVGFDVNKVTWLDGDSAKTIPLLNPKTTEFDLVLVDADHDPQPARADLFNAWPLVAQDGFLLFDDVTGSQELMQLWTFWKNQQTDIGEIIVRTDKKFGVAVARKQNQFLETSKIRKHILDNYPSYFGADPDKVLGIDIGCSRDPLTRSCVAFDQPGFEYKEVTRHGDARALPFADGIFDWVWSSHCLEHFEDTQGVLKEWLRVLKPGGLIGIYVPHPQLYHGQAWGPNLEHKHPGWTPEDLVTLLMTPYSVGGQEPQCEIIETKVHDVPTGPRPCYSTLVVARKRCLST